MILCLEHSSIVLADRFSTRIPIYLNKCEGEAAGSSPTDAANTFCSISSPQGVDVSSLSRVPLLNMPKA